MTWETPRHGLRWEWANGNIKKTRKACSCMNLSAAARLPLPMSVPPHSICRNLLDISFSKRRYSTWLGNRVDGQWKKFHPKWATLRDALLSSRWENQRWKQCKGGLSRVCTFDYMGKIHDYLLYSKFEEVQHGFKYSVHILSRSSTTWNTLIKFWVCTVSDTPV